GRREEGYSGFRVFLGFWGIWKKYSVIKILGENIGSHQRPRRRFRRADFCGRNPPGRGRPGQWVGTCRPASVGFSTAFTARKASISPAPNRSSRPFGPRAGALDRITFLTASGVSCGLRWRMSAATPLTKPAENEVPVSIL